MKKFRIFMIVLSIGTVFTQNLFFSEYAEGSSNNKYLEIYNPGNTTISLDGYAYPSVGNAPTIPGEYEYWNTFSLGATIEPGDVYVVCHPSADPIILAECDETFLYLSNGNDGLALVQGTEANFVAIDWIGDWNADPGSSWDVCGIGGTQDQTLVRMPSINSGNNWSISSASETCEWEVYPSETWTNLGFHEVDSQLPEIVQLSLQQGSTQYSIDVYLATPEILRGFQFELTDNPNIFSVVQGSGGLAESNFGNESVYNNETGTVLGFSMDGYEILPTESALLTTIYLNDPISYGSVEFDLQNVYISGQQGISLDFEVLNTLTMEVSQPDDGISLQLYSGWNWFSVNQIGDDMSLDVVLETLGDGATLIKNQTGFATYYDSFGWYGLDEIDVTSLYMIYMSLLGTLEFTGVPVDFENTPINLSTGWNWIGYLPQTENNLDGALFSIGESASMIKSQTEFATYYDGFGWYGMEILSPGSGYMINMNSDSVLVYGTPALAKVNTNTKVRSELNWTVDYRSFEHNMTITTQLNEGDQLAAFVGDECRGVTEATYFPLTDTYTANLMAYGEEGEELIFKVYKSGVEVSLSETIEFVVNSIVGNDIEPVLFKGATELIPTEFGLSQNYPNPFNPKTVIGYQLVVNSEVALDIYNINGQLIERLVDSRKNAGYHSVIWNAENLPSGLYFVRMTAADYVNTQKMLLVK
ncbi:MAG: T9SS type A sorting domain-containing protein [Candidatus Marinimicrobia bacterium]|nr:T9SS type A sorting domain-containing protein [Candidatus Neomarinimicrobiota bacterium]MBL7023409.1 T9SS type A sorting domain-containing protein [Candidatus Neomarinimicrobiota bacterium]MBL7109790.1 T9SS type A sorting domain-containing protein [Candidatus Neomarinimicrobiota bacterium]